MDLNELFKDVKSINKEATMKENMRMLSLKDNVTAEAFRKAYTKLAGYFNSISLDSPESNLTEFSRNKLSGKMKATLSVSTTAGLKRMPIHFVVKASVPEMVETPEQVLASLEQVEGSLDKEVKEILEKQKQMSAYHNEDIEVQAEDKMSADTIIRLLDTGSAVDWSKWDGYGLDEVVKHLPTNEYFNVDFDDNILKYWKDTNELNSVLQVFKDREWPIPDSLSKYSLANSNITVQAKKKEIDLGLRENTVASQFPVKLLVYPKTYLPKLKKGDILNVGGFKYKYIGDEPTISGDTENGINARFELICGTKKASLNVTADEEPKTTQEDIDRASDEGREMKKYLSQLAKEDLSDKSFEDIQLDVLSLLDYGQKIPSNYLKAIGNDRNLSLWFLSLNKTPITDLEGDVPSSIFKHIEKDAKSAYKVLTSHPTDTFTSFEKLPTFFQDVFMTDISIMLKIAEEHPEWVSEKMANEIIENSPSEAENLGTMDWNENIKNPAFQLFIDYAKSRGISNDVLSDKELGLEGYDGYEGGEPSDKNLSNIDEDDLDISDVNTLNEKNTREKKQMGVDYKEDTTGLGLDKAIREEERRQELGNEELGEKEDILDDNDEEEPVKKKTSSKPELEKEAVLDDLSFTADVNSGTEVDFYGSDQDWIALLKEHHPQFKDIPNDWITIYDVDWYGSISWTVDFDAREWGLKSMYISCKPSEIRAELHVDWYENSESADLDNSKDNYFTIPFKLTEIDTEVETNIGGGELLFLKKLEVDKDNTALALF